MNFTEGYQKTSKQRCISASTQIQERLTVHPGGKKWLEPAEFALWGRALLDAALLPAVSKHSSCFQQAGAPPQRRENRTSSGLT